MRRILIYFLLITICASCWREPEIQIKNVDELIYAIRQTETYMKKIPALSDGADTYTEFGVSEDGHISFTGSTFNYNPNDTTWEGRVNLQQFVDTCQSFPGLTATEWLDLRKKLIFLRNMGIIGSYNAFYNDGVFQFFYYPYILPDCHSYEFFYLALLTDSIVNTRDFKDRFIVSDKKKNLYLFHSNGY